MPDLIGISYVAYMSVIILVHGVCHLGFFYESWLYLVTLSLLTPDSIGFFSVAYVALIILVHGVCHLALCMRVGCNWLFYPS